MKKIQGRGASQILKEAQGSDPMDRQQELLLSQQLVRLEKIVGRFLERQAEKDQAILSALREVVVVLNKLRFDYEEIDLPAKNDD
jgi:hypothetical protein